MIRDAVIHLNNEQPLVADLFELPAATDLGLRCTNLRTLSGKRPVFVDDKDSVFFFPYLHIRFVEVLPRSLSEAGEDVPIPAGMVLPDGTNGAADEALDGDLEIDEDFLRRIREV